MKTALQTHLAEKVAELKTLRDTVRGIRADVKTERAANKAAKVKASADRKAAAKAKKAAVIEKTVARIAKAQAKLDALMAKDLSPSSKKKAARKASPVKVLVSNGVAVEAV